MRLRDSYERGRDRMYYLARQLEFSPSDVDTLEELEDKFRSAAYEAEEHDRSYSPFEFVARDLNDSRDPDAAWEEFERGLEVGLRKAWQERKAELAKLAGLEAPGPKRKSLSR